MKAISWKDFLSIVNESATVINRLNGETDNDYNKRRTAYIIERCVLAVYKGDVEGVISGDFGSFEGKRLLLIKKEYVDLRFIPCTYDTETRISIYFTPDNPIRNKKDESVFKQPAILHAIITDYPDDWQDCCRFMLAGNSEKFRF